MLVAAPSIPLNPNKPATIATMKKISAHVSINTYLFSCPENSVNHASGLIGK